MSETVSRFKKRLQESLKNKGTQTPTSENISPDDFESQIDRLIEILSFEIVHLSKGDHHKAIEFFEEKSTLVKSLEAQAGNIQHFMETGEEEVVLIFKKKLAELRELMDNNGVLIERASAAATAVSKEVTRILDRHSLRGIYTGKGTPLMQEKNPSQKYDGKI